jgi:RES domain-containing protein
VNVYRARAWRGGPKTFDPLDSTASIAGPKGWRYNDLSTEILYAAEVEALAILEVAVRPGWETIVEVFVATIQVPDGTLVNLSDLGIALPTHWNARPATDDTRLIAREFLDKIAGISVARPMGLRVPSVISSTDFTVLVDPSRKDELSASITNRIPFNILRGTGS